MNRRLLNCGYVSLVDSAPLIIAQTLGFADEEGIALNLLRQPSWAALRDLLAMGHLDTAHMLAPMPIAMTLGLSGQQVQTDALMVLSISGTVIGASTALAAKMRRAGWNGGFLDPIGTRRALISASILTPDRPVRVGVPFPYSMHRLLFSYWMGDAAARFTLVTTPPHLMADAVAAGDLDLFCVGEPWGAVAVNSGAAELILPGASIWKFAPEKVLGVRRNWADEHPETTGALMRAIYRAAEWLDRPENHALAAEILARSEHLDLPDEAIDRALSGEILPELGAEPVKVPNFLRFSIGGANFPWRSQAGWIGTQIAALHWLDQAGTARAAAACFRPDLFRKYIAPLGADLPMVSAKPEGTMACRTSIASMRGQLILEPDAFFDGKTYALPPD
ncbi:CmpA/NrtA family ABC transporter substrate-binding protein [Pseudorhodobacter sp. W20_MBD10_FR17]|uniref:CmpA/NrtA family ABC transporter substrate-binding protein n=1 Tax=Pseudorhodobacter sp. W20_MBD10_FR17 TaxID=3240266 RepID=UPI003F9DE055